MAGIISIQKILGVARTDGLAAWAGASLLFQQVDGSAPKPVFADPELTISLGSQFVLGLDGWPLLPATTQRLNGVFYARAGDGFRVMVSLRGESRIFGPLRAAPDTLLGTVAQSHANPLMPQQFGAVGDGQADDTAAIAAWIDTLIATGMRGYWPRGTYRVQLGQLRFQAKPDGSGFPQIDTAGHEFVILKAFQNIDAPFLHFHNAEASGNAGRYFSGGRLGGLSFMLASENRDVPSGDVRQCPNMHGLVLSGVQFCRFGHLKGQGIGGDTLHIPRRLYENYNPDPYHVAMNHFDGIEANFGLGRALNNQNYVGFAGNVIDNIRAIGMARGGMFGMGAGNRVGVMSVGSCNGWAIDEPDDVTGGGSSRFELGAAELDNVEYGIKATQVSAANFGHIRFVHRFRTDANRADVYWPRECLRIGNPNRPVSSLTFDVIDRIEAARGATANHLGIFANFSMAGGNLGAVTIRRLVQDNANIRPNRRQYASNVHAMSAIQYDVNGEDVVRAMGRFTTVVRARGTGRISNKPLNAPEAILSFPTLTYGEPQGGAYDPARSIYKASAKGLYRIEAQVVLAARAGTRASMAILKNGQATTNVQQTLADANRASLRIQDVLLLDIGDEISVAASQNSPAPIALSQFGGPDDNLLTITPV